MVPIPANLRPAQLSHYPPDNTHPFERWYMDGYTDADERERLYLPIQWTALYCNNNYGACNKTKLHIQSFLDTLDRHKKYYTIVQYDDGILNNISHLDIRVIAMSGPRIDYPIPLLSMPHQFEFDSKKDIFASFVGRITHPIRYTMVSQLKDKAGYYISTKAHSLHDYCEILARSKYALCPRGYGQSSFRIQESIQYGAVPVYISDEFVMPYDLHTFPFGIPIKYNTDTDIGFYLKSCDDGYPVMKTIVDRNKSMFTYPGCKTEILNYLKSEP